MSSDYDASQFGSTALWKEMQASFRELISQERKCSSVRSRKNAEKIEFSGVMAVDVLFAFLKNNESRFGGKEVTRTNAVKLLNIWLRERYIVPVCPSSEEFDVSKRTLYMFENDENDNSGFSIASPAPSIRSRPALTPRSFSSPKFDAVQRSSTIRSIRSLLPQSPRIIPKSPCYRLLERQASVGLNGSVDSEKALASIDEEELQSCDDQMLHDSALCLLLSLVDVSVLDEVLAHRQSAQFLSSHDKHNMSALAGLLTFVGFGAPSESVAIENSDIARRHLAENLVTRPLCNFFGACLACVPEPKLIDGVSRDPTTDVDKERGHLASAMFEQVKERYAQMTKRGKHSLFPGDYEGLLTAVCDQLLVHPDKEERLAEAMNYLVLLLPAHSRLALDRLLSLLIEIKGTDLFFKLAPHRDNADEAALQTMAYVMPSAMPSSKALSLFQRLIAQQATLFVWPNSLRNNIAKRLYQRRYTVAPPEPALRYCEPIKEESVTEAQRKEEEMLVTLMNQIIDHTKMPLEEKKQKIALFQKTYPALYLTHFRNLNW